MGKVNNSNRTIMFIDERTQSKIHADLDCSVISRTLRNCDIIPALIDVIKDTAEYAQMKVDNIIPEIVIDPCADEHDPRWIEEDTCWFCNELFDTLNSYAPEGYYFGAHIGDGSDFGFWKDEETPDEDF